MTFYVENESGTSFSFSVEEIVEKVARTVLDREDCPYEVTVNVLVTDDKGIREFNREYRGIDSATDVLSFPIYDGGEFDDAECRFGGAMLGDIVISLERAHEQAEELGNSLLREVAFLTIHSTLHLLGYDHERSKEDDEIQCEKQRQIISGLHISEDDK